MKSSAEVAGDFDLIAIALGKSRHPERLSPAERSLLDYVPSSARTALDAGCGDGRLTRALARRGISVLGIDLSQKMIELARKRTDDQLPIEYRVGDIMRDLLPVASFDVVISAAVVHHVCLDTIVPRLASLVAPGGMLIIQDVTTRRGARYFLSNVVAVFLSRARRYLLGGAGTREVAALYGKHGVDEEYLAASAVERAYRPLLPDAIVTNHIEWRYTVTWRASA